MGQQVVGWWAVVQLAAIGGGGGVARAAHGSVWSSLTEKSDQIVLERSGLRFFLFFVFF